MSCISGFIGAFALGFLGVHGAFAADTGWEQRLAETFSGRWREIQTELKALTPKLAKLPGIPIDDQGGTGGYAGIYASASPSAGEIFGVEVRWAAAAVVDLVALVPARRYDAKGLDAQYGLPDFFTVELIDEKGEVIRRVGSESRTGKDPVRAGHPFVYEISPPVLAAGLRISAKGLIPDQEGEGGFVHAWAEMLAFSGARNVALGGEVRSLGGQTPSAPWQWNPAFLVDGQTPLGLPETPAEAHGNIGWISEGRERADQTTLLAVDLGEPVLLDSVRLVPSKRPTSDLPSGFGFPRKLEIRVSETGEAKDPAKWTTVATRDAGNPGHNPVLLAFDPTRARHVRVVATQLWKVFDEYPAFFALSEVEILSGEENLALGKGMHSPDGMMNLVATGGRVWSAAALSDGFGPDGRLVPTREWLAQLDQRLRLETRRYQLRAEAARLVDRWRRTARLSLAILVVAGAFLIVALPIRYRLHANRELTQVRERIAGDLHDEVGSNLGSIQMFADLAEGRAGPSDELKRIQRIAAETVSAVRDIVWLLRPTGDHRIGTVEHLRETSSIMLETLDCRFTANEEAWQVELPEESNRDLFLYFREALHNIMRHAKAAVVEIRAEKSAGGFRLVIADDGVGIDPERLERPATLRALRQRAEALKADFQIESAPGNGTRLALTVPLERKPKRWRDALVRRSTAS
jgi:signal transduction histidine kinase